MNPYKAILLLVVLLICSCSTEPVVYSRNNYTIEKLIKLYDGIPVFKDSLVTKFVVKGALPKYPEAMKIDAIPGVNVVYVQPLIDEEGQVEAVYINQIYDKAFMYECIKAVLNSKFKSYYELYGVKKKYSLYYPYSFRIGRR